MAVNPTVKSFRLAQMQPQHVSAANTVSASPQTLAQIAASLGVTVDEAEKRMGIVCDQALSVRTVGSRTTATYTAA